MVKASLKEKVKEKRSVRRPARVGRPPKARAGEVDSRILDAAHHIFLERGLAGASIDEIARLAGAGKPTIYARFAGKEALFAAVVLRNVAITAGRFEGHIPTGDTIEERFVNVGVALLNWALGGDTINLMRVSISEASRFPDLASNVQRMARERAAETLSRVLVEAVESDPLAKLPAFAPERLATTTRFFMDLAFLPMIVRGLFGEKLKSLRAEIEPHVSRSVAFFLAACRQGGVS